MLVTWRAAAEQVQHLLAGVPELVLLARRNGDGVTGFHIRTFAFDAHPALAGQDEVNLLRPGVIMLLSAAACRQARVRQALIANARIAIRQQFADFGTVLGDECGHVAHVLDFHTAPPCWIKWTANERSNREGISSDGN